MYLTTFFSYASYESYQYYQYYASYELYESSQSYEYYVCYESYHVYSDPCQEQQWRFAPWAEEQHCTLPVLSLERDDEV